MVVYFCH